MHVDITLVASVFLSPSFDYFSAKKHLVTADRFQDDNTITVLISTA